MRQKAPLQERPISSEFSSTRVVVTRAEKAKIAHQLADGLGFSRHGLSLEVQPTGSLAAKDSAHDVFLLQANGVKSGEGKREAFACKRFLRQDNAEHELSALQEAARRGFRTLTPVGEGIYGVDGVGSILVTSYIPRFTTMNHLGWRDYYPGQEDYQQTLVPTLHAIGNHAGSIHKAGIIQKDLQLKNIAQIPPNSFVMFDMEGSMFFDPLVPGQEPPFEQSGRMLDDVGDITRSLVDKGFLWSATDESFKNEITDNLYMPYLMQTGMIADDFVEGLERVTQNALAQRREVHSGLALNGVF